VTPEHRALTKAAMEIRRLWVAGPVASTDEWQKGVNELIRRLDDLVDATQHKTHETDR